MTDRETITIPAPVARPGEGVEVQVYGEWHRGTVRAANWHLLPGYWRYEVVWGHGQYVARRNDDRIRRVEGGS